MGSELWFSFEEAARKLDDQERERLPLNEHGGTDLFAGDYDVARAELDRLERETNSSGHEEPGGMKQREGRPVASSAVTAPHAGDRWDRPEARSLDPTS